MVDYNQALTVSEALVRGRALQDEGIAWLEEPIRHDDLRGNAAIAAALHVPLQIGENFNGPEALMDALQARACDLVMPDLARIGGVSGWMDAAGTAAAWGIEMSSHLMPEVSAHLLAATPTRHWLEYVDWADAILEEPLRIDAGAAVLPDRPGHGWRGTGRSSPGWRPSDRAAPATRRGPVALPVDRLSRCREPWRPARRPRTGMPSPASGSASMPPVAVAEACGPSVQRGRPVEDLPPDLDLRIDEVLPHPLGRDRDSEAGASGAAISPLPSRSRWFAVKASASGFGAAGNSQMRWSANPA
jgi:hypothetical protein